MATLAGDTKLDINNLPATVEEEITIPLSVEAFAADAGEGRWVPMGGALRLSWPQMQNLPEAWSVTLYDAETGTAVDMRQQQAYEVTLEAEGKAKAGPSMTILNPQPPQPERLAKSAASPRFTVTVSGGEATPTEPVATPEVFALEQNYPNPFNPATSIQYSVAEAGQVHLAVYNVMGQQVETLVSGTKSAGTYRVRWDAGRRASGIYYYRLRAGGQVLTRQMTLIK